MDLKDDTASEMTEQRFNNLLIKFLLDEPFFSNIMRRTRKIKTDSIPTAGVTFKDDSICLYWNPQFVDKLTRNQMFGLLKHECYHLIFKHLTSRKQEPHLMWNIATDLAINSTIPSDQLPDGGLVPGKPLTLQGDTSHVTEEMKAHAEKMSSFIEALPANKASEWYMDRLRENEDLSESIEKLFNQSEDGQGSSAGFDYHFESNASDSENEINDAKVENIIRDAARQAQRTNSWGSVPSSMKAKIGELLKTEVDWKKVLQYFCGTKQKSNKTRSFRRINRKYPYIHPGRKVKHTSNLAIYIDQSGSVDNAALSSFFSALGSLSKNVAFTVFHFDSEVDVKNQYKWKKNSPHKFPMRTRYGGTNFDAVEDHFRDVRSAFDGYIVMTDGEAPKPKSCISKRCWVLLPRHTLYFEPEKRDTVVRMKT